MWIILQYLHAALVLNAAGKEITEKGIEAIIKAAGDKPDESKIKTLVATLSSVDINEIIKGASLMAATGPSTSAAPVSGSTDTGTSVEEEEEEEDEGDDLGLSSLFG